jgi:hypothetical protein
MEYGIEVNLRRALADVPGIAARLYPRSKLRWSGPDEFSEDACKMAGILKPGAHPRFEDAGFGVPQILLCPLNSLQKDVPVGSLPVLLLNISLKWCGLIPAIDARSERARSFVRLSPI